MNSWREFVQRQVLKSAIKQGKRASAGTAAADAAGILLLFPRDREVAQSLFPTIREWLAERDAKGILAVVPEGSEEAAKKLHRSVKTIVVTTEDITRNNLPTRELRKHLLHMPQGVVINLDLQYDPFTEVLYAIAPARFKTGLFHKLRDNYTSLMVQPRDPQDHVKSVQFLLDAISTFAGNRVPTRPSSNDNLRAAKRFATMSSTPPQDMQAVE